MMKITSCMKPHPLNHSSSKPLSPFRGPDLPPNQPPHIRRPSRRKTKKSAGGRRSRPETPLLRWKFEEGRGENGGEGKASPEVDRKVKIGPSARKLAAVLWRIQVPEGPTHTVGFESGAGNLAVPFHGHHLCDARISPEKELVESPHSVVGQKNVLLSKVGPSFQVSNSAMEGATKWDPINQKVSKDIKQLRDHQKLDKKQDGAAKVVSSLEVELEQARACIHELETERRSSKKKVEHFLKKLSEERAAWRSREHEKIRAIIDDMKLDLNREMKNCQRLEIVNSKLVNELADAKLAAKRYMQEYEKERKDRLLIEEVCDELAKEIREDKVEIEELKKESMGLQEEVEEERKMLQMAEVWREERVQMKLVDAKVILEDQYSQLSSLISDIEIFLNSRDAAAPPGTDGIKNALLLQQAAASVDIHDIREFTYVPPNPDDIFSVFEDVNCSEPNERQIEPCIAQSSEAKGSNKDNIPRQSEAYYEHSPEEVSSEWETVSHLEDQGSSYSPGASDESINRSCRDSDISRSGSEWDGTRGEGTPITEISKVCSVQNRQLKKVSSISRLWRSVSSNGENYKIISLEGVNGRLSNGALIPQGLMGEWSAPYSLNRQVNRGMKGCIEWPRNGQKTSLKSKLSDFRVENQKIQLRQVLKQKM